jgi:hypothetical protein
MVSSAQPAKSSSHSNPFRRARDLAAPADSFLLSLEPRTICLSRNRIQALVAVAPALHPRCFLTRSEHILQTLVLTGFAGKLRQRFDGHAIPLMNGRSCLSAAIHLSSRSVSGFNIGARASRRGRQVSRVLCDFQFCVTACGAPPTSPMRPGREFRVLRRRWRPARQARQ